MNVAALIVGAFAISSSEDICAHGDLLPARAMRCHRPFRARRNRLLDCAGPRHSAAAAAFLLLPASTTWAALLSDGGPAGGTRSSLNNWQYRAISAVFAPTRPERLVLLSTVAPDAFRTSAQNSGADLFRRSLFCRRSDKFSTSAFDQRRAVVFTSLAFAVVLMGLLLTPFRSTPKTR
jgi:hypothetical protein